MDFTDSTWDPLTALGEVRIDGVVQGASASGHGRTLPTACRRLAVALLGLSASCRLFGDGDDAVRIAWTVALPSGQAGWIGTPALAGNLAIAQVGGSLQAFDLASGTIVWHTQLRGTLLINAENVAVAAGRAFAAGGDSVYAVDAATGHRLWTFLPDAQAALYQITADGDAVYVGTRSHRLYALSADGGVVLWVVDVGPTWTEEGFVIGAALGGDTLYVNALQYLNPSGGPRTAHVIALDRRTGAELWRYVGLGDRNDATRAPRVAGQYLLVANLYPDSSGGSFFALDRFTGRETWRVRTAGLGPAQAPVVQDGVVYAGAENGWVYAVDLASGVLRWQRNVQFAVDYTTLCGRVLLANNQQLRVLDPTTGNEVQPPLLSGDVGDFPTSAFAVSGNLAFVVGNASAYGLSCPR